MRGLFKRLSDMVSSNPMPDDEYDPQPAVSEPLEGETENADEIQTDGFSWNGLPETGAEEEYRDAFRHGPLGVWCSWFDDPEGSSESIGFMADHTGITVVWSEDRKEEERCVFEWQPLEERCIRIRPVAWMDSVGEEAEAGDEEGEPEHEEEPEAELEEPHQGVWETIFFDFRTEEQDGEQVVVLHRADEDGFPCACRYGEGPLWLDWDTLRRFRDANLLRPAEKAEEELLVRAAQDRPSEAADRLLRPDEGSEGTD